MGHLIENDILKRSDFNDEVLLHQMALLIEKHPLNYKKESFQEITLPAESSRYFITIENKELDDPLSVLIRCPQGSADVIIGNASKELPTELDITNFFT